MAPTYHPVGYTLLPARVKTPTQAGAAVHPSGCGPTPKWGRTYTHADTRYHPCGGSMQPSRVQHRRQATQAEKDLNLSCAVP